MTVDRDLVIFACVHNAGRSQIAAAVFNANADPARARALSAGTQPAVLVHPEVVESLREIGLDIAGAVPRKFTAELAAGARLLVTMGCGEQCPALPGVRREDWPLADPKGRSAAEVRAIRDEIARRVEGLIARESWGVRAGP
jgi:arsenate reductase